MQWCTSTVKIREDEGYGYHYGDGTADPAEDGDVGLQGSVQDPAGWGGDVRLWGRFLGWGGEKLAKSAASAVWGGRIWPVGSDLEGERGADRTVRPDYTGYPR